MKNSLWTVVLAAGALLALVGCEQNKMTLDEMMQAPPRAPELDRLNAFLGSWHGESQMKITGVDEPMANTGESNVSWDVDNRYLVERFSYQMGEDTMQGMSLWTWDDKSGVYRNWWFDNYGIAGTGTVRYDAGNDVWRMKSSGRSMVNGQKTVGAGTIKFVDEDTMKWDYAEWDTLHLIKYMQMSGTSRRQ